MQRQESRHSTKASPQSRPAAKKDDAVVFQIHLTPALRERLEHAEVLLRSEHGLKVKRERLVKMALEQGLAHPEHLALALKTGRIQEFMDFFDEEEL